MEKIERLKRYWERINFSDNIILSSDRMKKIQDEIQILKEKYKLSRSTLYSLIKFETYGQSFSENNLVKIANLIHEILISYDYSEEEITAYMIKNKILFDSNYVDFRYRLALMHNIGLFDDVFFHHVTVLTRFFTENYYSTRTLYSVLSRNVVEDIQTNEQILTSISKSDLVDIKEKYPFDMEKLKKYDKEMIKYLGIKKLQTLARKKEM